MTTHASLTKDLSNLITDLDKYIVDNDIDYLTPPAVRDFDTLDIPSLHTVLSDLGLTFSNAKLYGVWPMEVVIKSPAPFLVIPFKNFEDISLVIAELKSGAVADPDLGYYHSADANVVEAVECASNTIYLVNSDVHHSYSYDSPVSDNVDDFGVFLFVAVNEDLSSYFE